MIELVAIIIVTAVGLSVFHAASVASENSRMGRQEAEVPARVDRAVNHPRNERRKP